VDYNKDSQNIDASFENGTAELGLSQQLVEPSKILLPSMHLKLDLMKNIVKAMNQEEVAFTYLREKFPRLISRKVFSLIHKYETLSGTNTSTSSFKATKRRLGTVLNL
jgi:hypothetical protein